MTHKRVNEKRKKASLRTWLRLLSCEAIIEQNLRSMFRSQFQVTLPQFDVLAELEHASRPLTMSELSLELMVSNGNITGVIDRLVTLGLVRRERAEHDRRIQYIQLTTVGSKDFKRMAKQHEIWISELFSGMNLDEMKRAQTLLVKLRNSVTKNKVHLV